MSQGHLLDEKQELALEHDLKGKPFMKTILAIWCSLFVGACMCSGALVSYSFTGAAGNEATFAADAQPTGSTASSMSRGSGLTAFAAADSFSSSAWTTGTTPDINDYYSFTITPDANYQMTLTRLELDERRSATGIGEWQIYSSLDNYATALITFVVPDDTNTRVDEGVNLGAAFSGLSAHVSFHIYGYKSEAATGTWRIDNVELSGSLTAIPEPASYGVISGIGLLVIFGLQTWRQHRAGSRVS